MFSGFEMEVSSGAAAGIADSGNYRAPVDPLPADSEQSQTVAVVCVQTPSVVNDYQQTIATLLPTEHYLAGSGGVHRIARNAVEIDPGMKALHTADRVGTPAELGSDAGGSDNRKRPDQPIVLWSEFGVLDRDGSSDPGAAPGAKDYDN